MKIKIEVELENYLIDNYTDKQIANFIVGLDAKIDNMTFTKDLIASLIKNIQLDVNLEEITASVKKSYNSK